MSNGLWLMRVFPVLLFLPTVIGCGESIARPVSLVLNGETQGTTYTIKLGERPPGLDSKQLQAEIGAVLERIDDRMSNWNPDSEVSRFNHYEGTDWFAVSADTATVVVEAQHISELSGGAFDITVGPLVDLWGFGAAKRDGGIPSEGKIEAARQRVGWRAVEIRLSPPALRKTRSDIRIDLSGIAQGFAVDQLAQLLKTNGAGSYFVEIGGEIRVQGQKADGTSWRIGIERPSRAAAAARTLQRVVALQNRSLATSGDYRHYREIDGKRYSHTIDPRTGRTIQHPLASVSVIAGNCMRADALATALMVVGPEEGYERAVEWDVAALLLIREDGEFTERATPEFTRIVDESSAAHAAGRS